MKNTFAKQGYMNVLIWVSQQPQFTNKDLLLHYPVSKSLIYDMNRLELIKKVGTATYKWNLERNPTQSDVTALRKKVNRHNALKRMQGKQLTIQPVKPIKRVERTQPATVHEEPICDNSNSKMFLIMAVGAAIGFLVATIIWK